MEDYKKLYEQTQSKMKEFIKRWDGIKLSSNDLFTEELKQIVEIESEDERIRKEIIEMVRNWASVHYITKEQFSERMTWLEKQGEPNPYSGVSFKYNGHTWGMCARDNGVEILVDGEIKGRIFLDNEPQGKSALEAIKEEKVDNEPKFKVGDWVVNKFGDSFHIDSLDKKNYQVSDGKGNYNYFPISQQDKMHLWTIKDGKDGDVLANDLYILILKELVYDWSSNGTPYSVKAYCGIKPNGNFEIGKDNWCFCGTLYLRPATKEQRDTLERVMTNAGYRWNKEELKLEKI